MGIIKEPIDIDFYVEPELLTDEERTIISQYILQYKIKHKRKNLLSTHPLKPSEVRQRQKA